MSSIAQVVRQVIDDLSDGVSELVLLVVVLAEQNQSVPAQLPGRANDVNKIAYELAKIAKRLTETEYVDFPEISLEITEAANAVETATSTLGNAVKILQTGSGELKQGWNALVDACRIMAGKTIRLLQIVYGADLKRLQLTADRLMDDIDKFDLNRNLRNKGDQNKFVGDMTDLTQKALKLAKHLNDRSNDPAISPFTRDMLKKAAQNLKDKAAQVVEAGNAALKDPTQIGKVPAALDDLKREINNAKALATQVADESPQMDSLKKLLPLIEKAERLAADVPAATKNPAKYEPLEKQMKDNAQELTKAIRPNPKLKRDADKIEEALRDQILAARKNLKNPTNPELNKELNKATQNLLDALNNLKKRNPDEKITPEQRQDFQKALDNLKKTFGPHNLKSPRDREQEAYERVKDLIDGMKQATREEDPKKLNHLVRQAVPAARELADKMKDPANLAKLPPYQRKAKEEAADNILASLPRIVKNASPFLKNPKDEAAAEDVMDAIRRLQRAAGPNRPKDEREMRDALADALNALKKTQNAAKAGKPGEADEGLDDLARALGNLRKAGDRLKEKNPDPNSIEKPLSELEKLFDKFKKNVPEAAKGNPTAMKEVDNTVPVIQKALNDLGNITKSMDIAPIQDVEDALDNFVIAADSDDPTRLAPSFKDLAQKVQDLGDFVETLPEPGPRKAGQKAMDELKPGLKELLQKAKEISQNPPSDTGALQDIVNRLKAPLAEFKKELEPKSYDRNPEVAGAKVKKALENLRNAMKTGDPAKIRKALDDVRDALDNYNDITSKIAKDIKDPKKRDLLDNEADGIRELIGDLRRVDPTNKKDLRNLLDQIPDRIDQWQDTLKNTDKDDSLKAMAKTVNLIASLGALDDSDLDLGDLLSTAGALSDLLRGLIGDTSGLARKLGTRPEELTPAAQAALNLDNFLRQLEGEEITLSLPPQTHVATFAPLSDELFEEITLDKAVTFDEVLAAVANEMHQAAKNLSAEADSLARELANLAKAARSGSRQEMLLAAKSASAFIIAFCKQLDILAKQIPGRTMAEKREQDNLFRYQQALKNYGTQLKILSSVKAASIEDSKDTDASLTTLTRNLGEVVHASLHSMAVTRDAIFAHKVK